MLCLGAAVYRYEQWKIGGVAGLSDVNCVNGVQSVDLRFGTSRPPHSPRHHMFSNPAAQNTTSRR